MTTVFFLPRLLSARTLRHLILPLLSVSSLAIPTTPTAVAERIDVDPYNMPKDLYGLVTPGGNGGWNDSTPPTMKAGTEGLKVTATGQAGAGLVQQNFKTDVAFHFHFPTSSWRAAANHDPDNFTTSIVGDMRWAEFRILGNSIGNAFANRSFEFLMHKPGDYWWSGQTDYWSLSFALFYKPRVIDDRGERPDEISIQNIMARHLLGNPHSDPEDPHHGQDDGPAGHIEFPAMKITAVNDGKGNAMLVQAKRAHHGTHADVGTAKLEGQVGNNQFTTWKFSVDVGHTVPVPEIDPASCGSVVAFVIGALGFVERKSRRRWTSAATFRT